MGNRTPLLAIIAVTVVGIGVLLAGGLGYFVWQERQNEAARAAHSEYRFTCRQMREIEEMRDTSEVSQRRIKKMEADLGSLRDVPKQPSGEQEKADRIHDETMRETDAALHRLADKKAGLESRWAAKWERLGLEYPIR